MKVSILASVLLPSRAATDMCLIAVALYALAAFLFDRYQSTRPTAEILTAYVRSLKLGASMDRREAVEAVMANCGQITCFQGWSKTKSLHSSKVIAGWREAHALEQLLVADLDNESALARLASATGELRARSRPGMKGLADEIDVLLRSSHKATADGGSAFSKRPQALLAEALRVLHNERDMDFENQSGTESKALALTLVGLLLIVVAGVAFHREALFLLGAIGGFISRLFRVLKRRPSLSDYGASWSTIMLAPVAGALSGWSGTLLLSVLSSSLHVLDSATFSGLWANPRSAVALGIAALLGVSERLFDRLVSLGEGAFEPAKAPARTQAAAASG
jgi:hypothetical protein